MILRIDYTYVAFHGNVSVNVLSNSPSGQMPFHTGHIYMVSHPCVYSNAFSNHVYEGIPFHTDHIDAAFHLDVPVDETSELIFV